MNKRRHIVLAGVEKNKLGIEIAPWFNPLIQKRHGYNVKILDIFNREKLLERARATPAIPEDSYRVLEAVDYVGSATEIADLVPTELHGKFDYIVSSHNFEHLPNPLKFLQGCEKLLAPGGFLSMAVPDCRACFDFYRPHTLLGDWLEAFVENRDRPTKKQVFEQSAYKGQALNWKGDGFVFSLKQKAADVAVFGDINDCYEKWLNPVNWSGYVDAHCTVMSPASLELLLRESQYLGLISLEIEYMHDTYGCEFYVRLRKTPAGVYRQTQEEMRSVRTELLTKIWRERALCVGTLIGSKDTPKTIVGDGRRKVKNLARYIWQAKIYSAIQNWEQRLGKRRHDKSD